MEPYRPFVDALVYQYFLDNPALLMLDRHAKQSLLHIPALDVGWGEETRPLMNAATLTAACLWKCYNGERKMLQYPVFLS
jgi:CRISPR-associated protein Cas1